ncbi:MAG: TetR/AcrR family transcriptional regulator [Pseudomonadota bacterium]
MTSNKTRSAYHHGDLANAVLDEVERIIEEQGLENVSLRACAKAVGVSHSALFRHYADKRDLLTAFAARGARRMAASVNQQIADVPQGKRFLAVGLAYIDYARKNPGAFRMIFREDALNPDHPDYAQAMQQMAAILAIGGHGSEDTDALSPKALLAWSSVHGIAMLCIDGSLSRDVAQAELEALIEQSLRALAPVLLE